MAHTICSKYFIDELYAVVTAFVSPVTDSPA
jgi:hypothetical protein